MRWRWWRRERPSNGDAAKAAASAAKGKLRDARRDWPEVIRAGDELSRAIEQALRGRGV